MEDQDLIPDTRQSNIMTRNSGCLRKIPVTRLDNVSMVNSDSCHTNHEYSCKNKHHNVNENNVKFNFYNQNDTELIYSNQLPNRHIQYLYSPSHFEVLHQNVRGLTKKTEELLISLSNLDSGTLSHRTSLEVRGNY